MKRGLCPAPRDSCGVFAVWGVPNAAHVTFAGLYALQHRGEESAGIVTSNGEGFLARLGMGLVAEVFTEADLKNLVGDRAIGHVRYSTTGASLPQNIQPFVANTGKGRIAVAHNGNLVNAVELHDELVDKGAIFQTTMDTEILTHLFARSTAGDTVEALVESLRSLRGAYSFVVLLKDRIIAARDPNGFRPLSLGRLGDGYVVASETSAFDLTGAEYLREIEPGEVTVISPSGFDSLKPFPKTQPSHCIFEYIYFARPDSRIYGHSVYQTRKRLGANLAGECPCDADMVTPIPDSGTYAALGYAQQTSLPFEMAVIRNHYIGRTFIQPSFDEREKKIRLKLNPIRDLISGKRLVAVEDSIVRGTTSSVRIKALREAGAREVHMRVTCPPHKFPCYYGIDFPTADELIASRLNIAELTDFLGLNSLAYLSREGMLKAMPLPGDNFCTACFDGRYPVEVDPRTAKTSLEKSISPRVGGDNLLDKVQN